MKSQRFRMIVCWMTGMTLFFCLPFLPAMAEFYYVENEWNYVDGSMDISGGIPETANGVLARIRERGVLRVSTELYYAPQEFIDPDQEGQDSYTGADMELARAIKETVHTFPQVRGVYDLVLNNYGPDTFNGSLHIEVPDTCSAAELDELLRQITIRVLQEHNVILTAIGVYSYNTRHDHAFEMEEQIQGILKGHSEVIQMHGFYVNEERRTIRFDVVISFDAKDRRAVYTEIYKEVTQMFPQYDVQIAMDTDFSES